MSFATSRQKGVRRPAASIAIAGNVQSTGTWIAGSLGSSGRLQPRNAPGPSGRQYAPDSISTTIGPPSGISGRGPTMTRCRRSGHIGSATPAAAARSRENGPAASTTRRVAIVPALVVDGGHAVALRSDPGREGSRRERGATRLGEAIGDLIRRHPAILRSK